MDTKVRAIRTLAGFGAAAALVILPAQAHHSFAMYDMRQTQVFTGVVDGIDPAPNHLSINFAVMNEERNNVIRDENGEPIFWSVEMGGSAAMARQGVSVNSFPRGTVFSVALHPLRNSEPGGSREGAMFRCPDGVRPEPGKHCDSVEGHVVIGDGPLPEPSE
ncbi:MAG TPA: DUF6152 family protein [Gammaproteobacteria bacterium]|nr:DUF6152 family protein [Gammaproteobacteria bacterium]